MSVKHHVEPQMNCLKMNERSKTELYLTTLGEMFELQPGQRGHGERLQTQ